MGKRLSHTLLKSFIHSSAQICLPTSAVAKKKEFCFKGNASFLIIRERKLSVIPYESLGLYCWSGYDTDAAHRTEY